MSEHAPEPWAVDGPRVYGANTALVATVAYCRSNADVENASRIVACVNACTGSKTQDLKHYASLGGVEKIMSLLEQDRDELREAISELLGAGRAVVERWDSPLWKDQPHTGEYIARLRITIDKYDTTTKETK